MTPTPPPPTPRDHGIPPPGGDDPHARLSRLLGGDDLAWLVERARRRLELGRPLTGTVTLAGATPAQRSAAGRLLGRRLRPGSALSVRLDDVDAVLVASGACAAGLAGAVRTLTGPVVVRAQAQAEQRSAWAAAWQPVRAGLADHPRAEVLGLWWSGEVAAGLPRRLAGTPAVAAVLARELLAVLARLPAGGIAIGSLAHAATGSAHALDAGPLPALVLRAARALAAQPSASRALPRSASADRATWAAVGVVRDELASTVLTLGLPAGPGPGSSPGPGPSPSPTGAALAAWNAACQPAVLTLRHLRLDPPVWSAPSASARPADNTVWSCENPVVLAAIADRAVERGQHPPPVVCTSGQPSAAAMAVLGGLRSAGWQVRHHGDLDPDGVRITERLVREVGAQPWRMDAADYRAALAAGGGRPASFTAVAASWDDDLAPTMAREGQVVEEEAVLAQLVADVMPPPAHPPSAAPSPNSGRHA